MVLAVVFVIIGVPGSVYAQVLPEEKSEGTMQSVYPIVGFSSDIGWFGGGIYQRINYDDGVDPFLSNTIADLTGSTNGKWSAMFEYERIRMLNRPLRTKSSIEIDRDPIYNFFGIGNNSEFSGSGFDEGIYYLMQKQVAGTFEIRSPLSIFSNVNRVDGIVRLALSYTENEDNGGDTPFFTDQPMGSDGGIIASAGLGLVYDRRNSEFDPRSGIRAEIGADFTPSAAINDYGFSKYYAELKSYTKLIEDVIFAQKLSATYSYGSTPFYELPALGNKNGLRGFAMNRYLGDHSVLYMAEVRSWIFRFFHDEIKIGGHAFYDTGRVFSDTDTPRFLESWKRTIGVGGAMSAFTSDLIFRGEIGFSEETYRIYAGVGFAF